MPKGRKGDGHGAGEGSGVMTVPSATQPIDDIDFGSPDFLRDPWTPLRALQRDQPVFWSRSQNAWIVTRHEDVLATFRDQRLSASRIVPFLETVPGGLGDDFPLIRHFEDKWISNVDLPIHARLRRLMANAFSKGVVEALRPTSRQICRDILDGVEGRDVDFVVDVARELPARVVTAMFGIPAELRDQFATWAGHIQQATGAAVLDRAMIELYHGTLVDMNVELLKLSEQRRAAPRDAQGLAVALGEGLSDGLGGGVPPPPFLLSQSFLTSAITAVASRMPPA